MLTHIHVIVLSTTDTHVTLRHDNTNSLYTVSMSQFTENCKNGKYIVENLETLNQNLQKQLKEKMN